jgi:hypothetical protein
MVFNATFVNISAIFSNEYSIVIVIYKNIYIYNSFSIRACNVDLFNVLRVQFISAIILNFALPWKFILEGVDHD